MSVNSTFELPSLNEFIGEARPWGLRAEVAERVARDALDDIRRAVLSCDHPALTELVNTRLDHIEAGPSRT